MVTSKDSGHSYSAIDEVVEILDVDAANDVGIHGDQVGRVAVKNSVRFAILADQSEVIVDNFLNNPGIADFSLQS